MPQPLSQFFPKPKWMVINRPLGLKIISKSHLLSESAVFEKHTHCPLRLHTPHSLDQPLHWQGLIQKFKS